MSTACAEPGDHSQDSDPEQAPRYAVQHVVAPRSAVRLPEQFEPALGTGAF
ncbi:hypothetical protein [Kitasatospora sp. NPDC057223]|uniref:hypothetical protein n=1 Tax=Kitasatospora sp. NPDC057223 TaxID=3346055 RepID=UPI003624F880